MAAYTSQAGQIVLVLSAAEAKALRDAAIYGQEATSEHQIPAATRAACEAALVALATACADVN